MQKKFDHATARDFMLAAGVWLRSALSDHGPDDPISVMFTYGPMGDRANHEQLMALSAERDLDVVLLEFASGREREGPRNVVVITREEGGGTVMRKRCTLWSSSDGTIVVIIPTGEDDCLAFNGFDLVRVPGQPRGNEERVGRQLAKRLIAHSAKAAKAQNLWAKTLN